MERFHSNPSWKVFRRAERMTEALLMAVDEVRR